MKDYVEENIRFVMKTELIVGDGSARELPAQLKSHSWGKIGLVIDRGLYDGNNYAGEIVALLEKKLEHVVLLINEMAEPTYDYLDEVKGRFRLSRRNQNERRNTREGQSDAVVHGFSPLMRTPGTQRCYRDC